MSQVNFVRTVVQKWTMNISFRWEEITMKNEVRNMRVLDAGYYFIGHYCLAPLRIVLEVDVEVNPKFFSFAFLIRLIYTKFSKYLTLTTKMNNLCKKLRASIAEYGLIKTEKLEHFNILPRMM